MSSPTYGTSKTANEQLAQDLSGILSLAPKDREEVEYTPRPELVRPTEKDLALPAPQPKVAGRDNPNWPESPEAKRKRLRGEATANRDQPGFEPTVVGDLNAPSSGRQTRLGASSTRADSGLEDSLSKRDQKGVFKARLVEARQGSPTTRRFLSEPPVAYRQPEATAPVDDLGEDETRKKRRREAAAKGGSRWRDFVPGF